MGLEPKLACWAGLGASLVLCAVRDSQSVDSGGRGVELVSLTVESLGLMRSRMRLAAGVGRLRVGRWKGTSSSIVVSVEMGWSRIRLGVGVGRL